MTDVIGGIGFVLLMVMVHEYGHYGHEYGHCGMGRLLGVPETSIRVELGANPPYVALLEADRWVSPMDDEYAAIFQRHCPGVWQAWSYIAGGVLLEAVCALAPIVTLNFFGAPEVAILLAWAPAALFAVCVVADIGVSGTRGQVSGDWSAMFVVTGRRPRGCCPGGGESCALSCYRRRGGLRCGRFSGGT